MISGGRITDIEGKKLKDGQISGMAVNINIDEVRAEGEKMTVAYTFAIDYQPEFAKLAIRGEIFIQEKNAKEAAEKWKKTRQFPPALAEELLTSINYAASAVGTLVSFGLGVNAPIAIPRARIAPQEAGQPQKTKAA